MDIESLTKFRKASGEIQADGGIEFFPVQPSWWVEADANLPVPLPVFLRQLLSIVGYGRIPTALDGSGFAPSANIVVAPHQIAREYRKQKRRCGPKRGLGVGLPFFLLGCNGYLLAEIGGKLDGCVTYIDDREHVVARSLEAFFDHLLRDPGFYADVPKSPTAPEPSEAGRSLATRLHARG